MLAALVVPVQEKLRSAENSKLSLENDISGLKDSIAERKMEAEREARKKERMEKEMKELKASLEARQSEIKAKQQQVRVERPGGVCAGTGRGRVPAAKVRGAHHDHRSASTLLLRAQVQVTEEQVQRLEGMLRDTKYASEKVQKEYNQLNEKVQKLHHDLEEQIHTNTQLLADNSQKQVELRVKEDEIAQIKAEAARVNKLRDQTAKRIKQLEDGKADVRVGGFGGGAGASSSERRVRWVGGRRTERLPAAWGPARARCLTRRWRRSATSSSRPSTGWRPSWKARARRWRPRRRSWRS